MAQTDPTKSSNADLIELGRSLIANGPHRMEPTSRRVRGQSDTHWLFDTTSAYHVWEHPYYPQFYILLAEIKDSWFIREEAVSHDDGVYVASLRPEGQGADGEGRILRRALVFRQGLLKGLVRFDFKELDAWYEEDQPIYGHPKDPYKRIDILPSSRKITVKFGDVVVAESTLNMFLFETMLRTRYYMPKTAVSPFHFSFLSPASFFFATYDIESKAVVEANLIQIKWQYTTPSSTTSLCPYKGTAEYYNLSVDGTEIKDAIWWYRSPTHESAPIAGMACFYNEKVDVFVDGVKEKN
ncbi:MAG: hypothetical protein LQ350_004293 [Teloschistes chrysophthalmus]|nr:MAG: hypothetical protein LQ350_004293 [Niorma chrysophthalma]